MISDLLKNLCPNGMGVVSGPGISDLFKIVKHSLYRKKDETDREYAGRVGFEMLSIIISKPLEEWLKNAWKFRSLVQETWAIQKSIIKRYSTDGIADTYSQGYYKIGKLNVFFSTPVAKLAVRVINRDKFNAMYCELFLFWWYSSLNLTIFGLSGSLPEYDGDYCEITTKESEQIWNQFEAKVRRLKHITCELAEAIPG